MDMAQIYQFRLYITREDDRSVRAERNLRAIFEKYFPKRSYDMEVIDITQYPSLLDQDQVLAIPTLVRKSPAPERRVVGDMSEYENVVAGMGLS